MKRHSQLLSRGLVPLALFAIACGGDNGTDSDIDAGTTTDSGSPDAASVGELPLRLLYVHGVKSCEDARMNAERSLIDLEAAIADELPARIASYEADHPGVSVVAHSGRANLYTATSSGQQPSDSADPLLMDDWEVGDPGCATSAQGEACTAAYEWRYRLVQEIDRLFPGEARNIVLIGHSTGVRTALEVAANVGPGGIGSHDWGVQDRIAGVVSVHGMVDSLGDPAYDVIGPLGFVTSCKFGDVFAGFGNNCAQGNGWCEYAGQVSAREASDWVAENRQLLTLVSHDDCGLSAFSGSSDGALPIGAQASSLAPGLSMAAADGDRFQVAHGDYYGTFCHSAIDSPGNPRHAAAVEAVRTRILDWLFLDARAVAATGSTDVSALDYLQSSPSYQMGAECPVGHEDGEVEVVGACRHPGLFDGDDHIIDPAELTVTDDDDCSGSFHWTQSHDQDDPHAGELYFKAYSRPSPGGALQRFELE